MTDGSFLTALIVGLLVNSQPVFDSIRNRQVEPELILSLIFLFSWVGWILIKKGKKGSLVFGLVIAIIIASLSFMPIMFVAQKQRYKNLNKTEGTPMSEYYEDSDDMNTTYDELAKNEEQFIEDDSINDKLKKIFSITADDIVSIKAVNNYVFVLSKETVYGQEHKADYKMTVYNIFNNDVELIYRGDVRKESERSYFDMLVNDNFIYLLYSREDDGLTKKFVEILEIDKMNKDVKFITKYQLSNLGGEYVMQRVENIESYGSEVYIVSIVKSQKTGLQKYNLSLLDIIDESNIPKPNGSIMFDYSGEGKVNIEKKDNVVVKSDNTILEIYDYKTQLQKGKLDVGETIQDIIFDQNRGTLYVLAKDQYGLVIHGATFSEQDNQWKFNDSFYIQVFDVVEDVKFSAIGEKGIYLINDLGEIGFVNYYGSGIKKISFANEAEGLISDVVMYNGKDFVIVAKENDTTFNMYKNN